MGIVRPTGDVTIKLLNAHGNGFTDTVKVTGGTTLGELFDEVTRKASPSSYQITVNREPADRGYLLQDGDRVSITPAKIEGAR